MTANATQRAQEMWSQDARWAAILEALRTEGFSKVDAIRASVDVLRLPLADAKRLVHDSEAWADTWEQDERFLDELVRATEGEAAAQAQ